MRLLRDLKTNGAREIGALVAVVMLVTSTAAHADPVYMACTGQMLLSNKRVDMKATLSLTIDLRAGTVTVGGYQPVVILPAIPAPAKSGIKDTERNELSFMGSTIHGMLSGSVDRVTGEANITFDVHSAEERFFSGICRTAQKLF